MPVKIKIAKKEIDPWLDDMNEDQRVDLSAYVGKTIEIQKGFIYDSKKWGTGFTFQFCELGTDPEDVVYTTSFGTAIVRQAREQIIPALETDSVIVRVTEGTSKTYGSKYLVFESAD